ncbi:MAG: class I SAM-dependent methyltransferase [Planctomycetales bacterium]|nr:class I SAM-dependent methyltransferase [Planctomycetales bacterium]
MSSLTSGGESPEDLWTEFTIGKFWDHVCSEPRFEPLYFSKIVAEPLTHLVRWFVQDRFRSGVACPTVLDYGCGPGYLTEALVKAGMTVAAMEFSAGSVRAVNQRLSGVGPGEFLGATSATELPTPIESDSFDVVISTEAYEHLRDEWIAGYFAELNRICKPHGWILVTTPHQEHLDDNLCLCPSCHQMFHRWGHLRSVTRQSISEHAQRSGLEVQWTSAIKIDSMGHTGGIKQTLRSLAHTSPIGAARWIRRRASFFTQLLNGTPAWRRHLDLVQRGPHLVMVAKPMEKGPGQI